MFSPASRIFAFTIILVLHSAALLAQPHDDAVARPATGGPASTGSIAGKVVPQGATPSAVAGTQVLLRRIDEAAPVAAEIAGVDGSFVFYDLAPGEYSLTPDASSLPARFKAASPVVLRIIAGKRADIVLDVEARRSVTGRVFVDVNGDGLFTAGKDTTLAGAEVSAAGVFAVSDAGGSFRLADLPSGRTSIIVQRAGDDRTTHVVLDLAEGPVTDRIVNICLYR
jgi:hypothetical protein